MLEKHSLPETHVKTALKTLVFGGVMHLASDNITFGNTIMDMSVRLIASGTMISGISQLIDAGIVWYAKKHTRPTKHIKKIKQPKKLSSRVSYYYQLKRAQQVFIRTTLSACTTVSLYRILEGIISVLQSDNLSLLSLQYNDNSNVRTLFSPLIDDGPIFLLPNLLVSLYGLYYNLNEIRELLKTILPRPGDSTFMTTINALSLLSASAHFFNRFGSKLAFKVQPIAGTDEATLILYETKPLLFMQIPMSYVNHASALTFYQGMMQMFNQSLKEFMSKFEIEVEEFDEQMTDTPVKPKAKQRSKPAQPARQFTQPRKEFRPQVQGVEAVKKSPKIKTRGVAFKNKTSLKTVNKIEGLSFKRDDHERPKMLKLVAQYRRAKEIKKSEIEGLLAKLVKFLPEGAKLSGRGGSKFQITWDYQNRHYSLKFEKPHGNKPDYQGFKLSKVLNIIETGYLWGWYPDNIQAHIDQQVSGILQRFRNILFQRPSDDVPMIANSSAMRL